MALLPMSPGGRWMRPPHDAPPVYVPAKQVEAHYKRLVGENWTPIDDPRTDDGLPIAAPASEPAITAREVAMQAQIDQLTALVQQFVAQKEQDHASTPIVSSADSESPNADQRSGRRKPAV